MSDDSINEIVDIVIQKKMYAKVSEDDIKDKNINY